jgi:hypothetical protein
VMGPDPVRGRVAVVHAIVDALGTRRQHHNSGLYAIDQHPHTGSAR